MQETTNNLLENPDIKKTLFDKDSKEELLRLLGNIKSKDIYDLLNLILQDYNFDLKNPNPSIFFSSNVIIPTDDEHINTIISLQNGIIEIFIKFLPESNEADIKISLDEHGNIYYNLLGKFESRPMSKTPEDILVGLLKEQWLIYIKQKKKRNPKSNFAGEQIPLLTQNPQITTTPDTERIITHRSKPINPKKFQEFCDEVDIEYLYELISEVIQCHNIDTLGDSNMINCRGNFWVDNLDSHAYIVQVDDYVFFYINVLEDLLEPDLEVKLSPTGIRVISQKEGIDLPSSTDIISIIYKIVYLKFMRYEKSRQMISQYMDLTHQNN